MENKVKNIVCNHLNACLVEELEEMIVKLNLQGWGLREIQDCMIVALQNQMKDVNL